MGGNMKIFRVFLVMGVAALILGACAFNPKNGLAGTTWEYEVKTLGISAGERIVFEDADSGYQQAKVTLLGAEAWGAKTNFTYTFDSATSTGTITWDYGTTETFSITGNELSLGSGGNPYKYKP